MSTFLMLSTVGPDGAATLAENPDRLKAVNAEVESMGVRVLAQWALLGPYDFCTVLDAPDEKTMARVALVLGRARDTQNPDAVGHTDRRLHRSGPPTSGRLTVQHAGSSVPPEALPAPLASHVVPREELAENAAVGESPDAVALRCYLSHLEASRPRALIAVAHIDLRAGGQWGPCVRLAWRPPGTHTPIVLKLGPHR